MRVPGPGPNGKPPRYSLAWVLSRYRGAFTAVGLFSGVINILLLTGSMFMLQVYDRVLPSRSVPTLLALVALVAVLYAIQGVLELVRSRVLSRIGASVDEELSGKAFQATVEFPLKTRASSDGLQALRDLDQVRGFLGSLGPTALFDLPWMPVYLGICFLFHVWIGATALAGAVILVALTVLTELWSRVPAKDASRLSARRLAFAEASRRNAEVLRAMGMTGRVGALWGTTNERYTEAQLRASDVVGGLGALSRVLRMMLQPAVLAVGAYLVIMQEATAGIIIASSILVSRALAPVELAIANWRGFLGARQSWKRLSDLVGLLPADDKPKPLPPPRAGLSVEAVSIAPPGIQRIVVQDAAFALKAGQGLGVIGPTASGKSSLARALVGVWQPARGKVRLDGAALEQWEPEALGRHIGYLPQDIELLEGSIAQTIARFDPDPDPAAVIAAARAAGVHDLVLRLPEGYETAIGEAGTALSAGQRQRIALARALYGDPFLVVLDEPNSNLDSEGEEALTQALLAIRARGGIVVVVAHRPTALMGVDHVLAMAAGRIQAFGPKDEVLRQVLLGSQGARARAVKVVGDGEG